MISKLGDDLLVEILIRSFPNPKSACRCKVVCKRWSSLISSPCFNRRFVSHRQRMNLMNQPPMPENPNELKSIILSFLPPMPNEVRDALIVLDCNKDLVLCGFWDFDSVNSELGRSHLVCNPFTKQWIALPLAPEKSERFESPVARLVCEPRVSTNFDLGDGRTAFVYSEYRFRVVYIHKNRASLKLDVFCSESGEWTTEALAPDGGHHSIPPKFTSSCNGELFWMYLELLPGGFNSSVAVLNPFRLDIPPARIDMSAFKELQWVISVSQGVLHVITYSSGRAPLRVIIWRLEEDGKSWRKQCEGLVEKLSRCSGYEPQDCFPAFLHPCNPDIVFFHCVAAQSALLSSDLRKEELEFHAKLERKADYLVKVFEPRISCWPTPIPRYEELRSMYNGNYSFWDQRSSEATTPSLPQ